MPRPPALAVPDDQAGAGDPAHAGLHDRVWHADEVGERRAELLPDHCGTSSNRRPRGSSISRMITSSSYDGSRVDRHVLGDLDGEAGGLDDLVDRHARVHGQEPHRVVGGP